MVSTVVEGFQSFNTHTNAISASKNLSCIALHKQILMLLQRFHWCFHPLRAGLLCINLRLTVSEPFHLPYPSSHKPGLLCECDPFTMSGSWTASAFQRIVFPMWAREQLYTTSRHRSINCGPPHVTRHRPSLLLSSAPSGFGQQTNSTPLNLSMPHGCSIEKLCSCMLRPPHDCAAVLFHSPYEVHSFESWTWSKMQCSGTRSASLWNGPTAAQQTQDKYNFDP